MNSTSLSLYFAGSKSAVTLLLLPAAIHLAVGFRVAPNVVIFRAALDRAHRLQVEALRPFIPAKGGLVLATDYNAMVRLRQRMDVETLIYTLLISAGAVDPEPVRRDLEHGVFATVVLPQDVFAPESTRDLEVGTLPPGAPKRDPPSLSVGRALTIPLLDDSYVYQPAYPGRGS